MRTTAIQRVRRRPARDEAGFALVELLIVAALLGVVLFAVLSLLDAAVRVEARDQERAHAVREAQVGLDRMTRELRQAYRVVATGPSYVTVHVRLGGQDTQVHYRCDRPHPDLASNPHDDGYRRCRRVEALVGAALPAIDTGPIVIDRVLNGSAAPPDSVFTFSPSAISPTYIRARIEVPARGEREEGIEHKVVLDDGFFMRNLRLG